jgi:hypothetical protein
MNPETHPIDYETEFEHSDLEKVKLSQQFDDRTKRVKNCPVFSGKYGLESLLYVEDRFRKVATQLTWTDEELFIGFEEVLLDHAEDEWEDIVQGLAPADRDDDTFDACIQLFYLKYCSEEARDEMFKYLETQQCRKPVGMEPRKHVSRLLTLYRYSNRLPGLEPPKAEEQQKMPIFLSFPESWRKSYILTGRKISDPDTSIQSIIDFMTTMKSFADKESGNRNKKRKVGDHKEEKMEAKNKNKNKTSGPEAPCKKPGHRGHKWKDCFDNPRGNNFRPQRGFGGGGGRGNGGGRFNNNNNNYNRNNDRFGGGRGGRGDRGQQQYNGQGQRENGGRGNGGNYHYQGDDLNRVQERGTGPQSGRNNDGPTRQPNAVPDQFYNVGTQRTRVHWW